MEAEQKLSPPPPPPREPTDAPIRRRRKYVSLIAVVCAAAVMASGIWIGMRLGRSEPAGPGVSVEMQAPPETNIPPSDTVSYQSADNGDPGKETPEPPVDGAIEYNGNYYKVYDLGLKWTEAKTYCEDLGGHLVTITSPEEQEAVQRMLENAARYEYWIGAHYVDGSFVWVTGEPFVYGNSPGAPWGEGQPDHDRTNTANPEEYVQIFAKDTEGYRSTFAKYTWNDLMNDINVVGNKFFTSDTVGFICEWEGS